MRIFNSNENRIKCGRCDTEFDLNKNSCCPLCRFGSGDNKIEIQIPTGKRTSQEGVDYLKMPLNLDLKPGKVTSNEETETVGSWGMFNSFFPGKAVLRISSNRIYEQKAKYIVLEELVGISAQVFKENNLSKLRGFPNDPYSESSIGRLVTHFIRTFSDMGLFEVKSRDGGDEDIWDQSWKNIEITPTKEGLEFARLKNNIFDEKETLQLLTPQESQWIINYLKKIDKEYKEFSILKEVYDFLKEGHNGKDELWEWFIQNKEFIEYVRGWSRKSGNENDLKAQIKNLAPTFSSAKIALLRELGIIKNKRNDYTVIGELK